MTNPWDRLSAEQGNQNHDEIFTAVGRALSDWELLDQAIACLFTFVTVGSYYAPSTPALREYSLIVSSSNRIRKVRASLEGWLRTHEDCPLGGNALTILSECSGWAGRRNDIAHGVVDRSMDEFKKGWFLIPKLYAKEGRNEAGKVDYRYNAEIIYGFGERFIELHNRLNETVSAIGEWHRIAKG